MILPQLLTNAQIDETHIYLGINQLVSFQDRHLLSPPSVFHLQAFSSPTIYR